MAGSRSTRMCRFGLSGHRVGRRGGAWHGAAWHGRTWQARLGLAGRGMSRQGEADHGRRGTARLGMAWPGVAWQVGAGRVRPGMARLGAARQNMAGLSRPGTARPGRAWRGRTWQARLGVAGQGMDGLGKVFYILNKGIRMQIETIKWKQNVPSKGVDAAKAHKALEAIREKNNGLTDDGVLAAASVKGHTLNKWFEWDDSTAASVHRRDQARQLIRSLEVTYSDAPGIKTRVYEVEHKSRPQDPQRTVYTTTEEVLANPESRDRLIAEAIKAAMQFRRRFKMLHELDGLMLEIDKVVEKMGAEVLV